MTLTQRSVTVSVLLFLTGIFECQATTIAIVIAKDGSIVIATDSKVGVQASATPNHPYIPEIATKYWLIDDHIAVAAYNNVAQHFAIHGRTLMDYDSTTLLEDVRKSLAPNASLVDVERSLTEKLNDAVVNPFRSIVQALAAEGKILNYKGDWVVYLIAGYENGAPTVRNIHIDADGLAHSVSEPIVGTLSPTAGQSKNFYIGPFAQKEAIDNALNDPNSPERQLAIKRFPGVINAVEAFTNKEPVSTKKAISIASDMIRLEMASDSKDVGPPINVVILSNTINLIPSAFRSEDTRSRPLRLLQLGDDLLELR